MTKETIKINLPPPPSSRGKSGRSGKGVTGLLVAFALVIGLAGGFFAGWKMPDTLDGKKGAASDEVSGNQGTGASAEISGLLIDANSAVTAGKWVEARDLFQKVLNRDPENTTASISMPLVNRHLDGAKGGLKITTTPEGATVQVGEHFTGKTPVEFDKIPLGKYDVTVLLDGYQPVKQSVTIKEDETIDLAGISMVKSSGGLNVNSEPKGAEFKVVKTSKSALWKIQPR